MKISVSLTRKPDPNQRDIELTLSTRIVPPSKAYVVKDKDGNNLHLHNKCLWFTKSSLGYSINNFIKAHIARLGEDATKTDAANVRRIRNNLVSGGYIRIVEVVL